MSAVIGVLLDPAVDAVALQLISQGLSYWQDRQAQYAKGMITPEDVAAMADKLDADISALMAARVKQVADAQATQQQGINAPGAQPQAQTQPPAAQVTDKTTDTIPGSGTASGGVAGKT